LGEGGSLKRGKRILGGNRKGDLGENGKGRLQPPNKRNLSKKKKSVKKDRVLFRGGRREGLRRESSYEVFLFPGEGTPRREIPDEKKKL